MTCERRKVNNKEGELREGKKERTLVALLFCIDFSRRERA
jgi:hypothetical protein